MKTKGQLQREACLKRAREYSRTARQLYRAIADLDRNDPESMDAAREWSICSDECREACERDFR